MKKAARTSELTLEVYRDLFGGKPHRLGEAVSVVSDVYGGGFSSCRAGGGLGDKCGVVLVPWLKHDSKEVPGASYLLDLELDTHARRVAFPAS